MTDHSQVPLSRFGKFYPRILEEPEKYILKQPELFKLIKLLRIKYGKNIFCLTNSHLEYTEHLLQSSFGPNWRDCFDVILSNCRKPLWQRGNQPFHVIDRSVKTLKGEKVDSGNTFWSFSPGKHFLEGNGVLMTEYL